MSSRLTRTLLKLYPRRILGRNGDELPDLEDELWAKGELSRTRLLSDMPGCRGGQVWSKHSQRS
jgi:hypothetical protein